MKLQLANNADTLRIFEFERENEQYFREKGIERNALFYQYNRYIQLMNDDLQEQKRDRMYMYLIVDDTGKIIGRLELDNVIRHDRHRATLKLVVGQGCDEYVTTDEAVSQIAAIAKNVHQLSRLEANCEVDDVKWQIALLKGGFRFAGKYSSCKLKGANFTDVVLMELNL